jgi:hypothetical protein
MRGREPEIFLRSEALAVAVVVIVRVVVEDAPLAGVREAGANAQEVPRVIATNRVVYPIRTFCSTGKSKSFHEALALGRAAVPTSIVDKLIGHTLVCAYSTITMKTMQHRHIRSNHPMGHVRKYLRAIQSFQEYLASPEELNAISKLNSSAHGYGSHHILHDPGGQAGPGAEARSRTHRRIAEQDAC